MLQNSSEKRAGLPKIQKGILTEPLFVTSIKELYEGLLRPDTTATIYEAPRVNRGIFEGMLKAGRGMVETYVSPPFHTENKGAKEKIEHLLWEKSGYLKFDGEERCLDFIARDLAEILKTFPKYKLKELYVRVCEYPIGGPLHTDALGPQDVTIVRSYVGPSTIYLNGRSKFVQGREGSITAHRGDSTIHKSPVFGKEPRVVAIMVITPWRG